MTLKTPKFDKALDLILNDLVPCELVCLECKQKFKVEAEDINFYNMFRVPPPKECPLCRKKRRYGQYMRMPKFFKKKCSVPGHTEEVISIYPPNSPHKVYDFDYYISDKWEATEWGRDYNAEEPFFKKFSEFFFEVPHIPLERDPKGINCEYTLGGRGGKDNYYTAMGFESQTVSYCFDVRYSRDLLDCNVSRHSELCYENVSSHNCHNCIFTDFCDSCLDSSFLYDCKNCNHCFMSYNLRNKSYVFYNEQLTKQEYDIKIKSINLGNRDQFKKYRDEFLSFFKNALRRSVQNINTTGCVGDGLINSKECYFCFRADNCNNIRYSENDVASVDCMDIASSLAEKSYESIVVFGGSNKLSMYIRDCSFVEYCIECNNSHYCFGCVGLKNKRFHIFNKAYGEDEYWEKIDEIKTAMLSRGEYGEFFSLGLGLMPYQSSNGQMNFPIDDSIAVQKHIPWYPEEDSILPLGVELAEALPKDIKEVSNDILKKTYICEVSGKPYRFMQAELDFYRKMNISLPSRHPWQRIKERVAREHSLILYDFVCPSCQEKSYSVYNLEQQNELKIFCEKCYLKEVV